MCIRDRVMVRETNRRLAETAEKNERNQAAILRLLDEIADLADGDLTVAATVTEDFTGAIADSINYSCLLYTSRGWRSRSAPRR